jgi:hypothetical protein
MDLDERKLLEKKNNQMKFYLREIDIDKNLSGSAESLSISSNVSTHQAADEKGNKGEEFSASFVAQTNWTFVEKLLKVRRKMIYNVAAVECRLSFRGKLYLMGSDMSNVLRRFTIYCDSFTVDAFSPPPQGGNFSRTSSFEISWMRENTKFFLFGLWEMSLKREKKEEILF